MTISKAKKQYNEMLERYYNGVKYLDDDTKKYEERLKFLPLLEEIMARLNKLLYKIHDYTEKEILEGFKVLGGLND